MRKIFRLLMVAATIVLGAFYFFNGLKTRALDRGEVNVRQQPKQPDDKARPDNTTASTDQLNAASQPAPPEEVASNGDQASGNGPSQTRFQFQFRSPSQKGVAALPASDTISRKPPNGIVTAGSSKFQLYRQGDMTFRLNTATGQACVLFASNAQWRKPLVYDHGCGTR